MTEPNGLATTLEHAVRAFFAAVVGDGWRGRERESVSLFAFEFLVPRAHGAALASASQIGIECAVPQVTSGGKRQVCKDLVIWPRPRMTVWDQQRRPTRAPHVIMEWKVVGYPGHARLPVEQRLEADIAWLERFTNRYPTSLGVAVGIHWGQPSRLKARRVVRGRAEDRWWLALEERCRTG